MSQNNFDTFNELDDDIKREFYEDVVAAIGDINQCAQLLEAGSDAQVIDRMFRALHTVKGNCNMVFLTDFVNASHKLEDLFSDIRSGEIEYNDTYGNFAVVAINTIKIELDSLMNTQSANTDILASLESTIEEIERSSSGQRLLTTEKAIIAIQDGHFNLDLVAMNEENGQAFSFLESTDSEFFQFISDKQIKAKPETAKFIEICETLAVQLNSMLGRSMDEEQLKTAITFVILSNLISNETHPEDLTIEQIFFASGLLSRMSGWSEAAEVVLQLKENYAGSGAPLGLEKEQISPAAQALALAFEFTFIVMKQISSGYKKSLFSAVKLINAKKDKRYKARLIERFNQLIKQEYLTNQMW